MVNSIYPLKFGVAFRAQTMDHTWNITHWNVFQMSSAKGDHFVRATMVFQIQPLGHRLPIWIDA